MLCGVAASCATHVAVQALHTCRSGPRIVKAVTAPQWIALRSTTTLRMGNKLLQLCTIYMAQGLCLGSSWMDVFMV